MNRLAILIVVILVNFNSFVLASWQEELKQKVEENNPPAWMLEQIREDLAPFQTITDQDLETTLQINNPGNYRFLVRFVISNNEIFVKTNDSATNHPRCLYLIQAFESLARAIELPNVDFILSLHDCLTYEDRSGFKAPVLCFAKQKNMEPEIVLMPDFEALLGNYDFLNQVSKGIGAYPWEKKVPIAVWRGATTGGDDSFEYTVENFLFHPRSELVTLSLGFPFFIDARFTILGQTPEPEKIIVAYAKYFGKSIPVSKHLLYKYQILIDGNSCAYSRAYWQLFCNCVIFKQDSEHIQWFYRALKPNVHYVPIKHHLEDLIEKIAWAQEHDDECFQISNNAQDFANKNLKHSDIMYYLYLLLSEYAKIIKR